MGSLHPTEKQEHTVGGPGWSDRLSSSGAPGTIRAPVYRYSSELQITHTTSSGGRLDQLDPQ